MADPVQPREGDVAFAVSVATLYDLTIGRIGWDVRLTRWAHATKPTLTLANRVPGAPVLSILPWDFQINPDALPVFEISNQGVSSMTVQGYLDLVNQVPAPSAPPSGSGMLRMYHRGGQLFFKLPGTEEEQQIPIGTPPGETFRYAFWFGGG